MIDENANGRAEDAADAMSEDTEGIARSIGTTNEALPQRVGLFAWRKAIAASGLKPRERLVAYTLAGHMNRDGGSCYPSLSTIAAESGLGERTAQAAIGGLEAAGYVLRDLGGGRARSSRYVASTPTQTPQDLRPSDDGNPAGSAPYSDGNPADHDEKPRRFRRETPQDLRPRKSRGRPKDVRPNNVSPDDWTRAPEEWRGLEDDGKPL